MAGDNLDRTETTTATESFEVKQWLLSFKRNSRQLQG